MYPSSIRDRGKLLQWTFFVANEVEPAVITILRNRIILPPQDRNAAAAQDAEAKLSRLLDIMDRELHVNSFFAVHEWGLADFMIACVMYIVHVRLKMELNDWPQLKTWTETSVERPAALIARKLREPL